MKANKQADVGRHALAALEFQPDRKEVAEKCAEAGRERRFRAEMHGRDSTATVPLSMSQSNVAAASPLRPVRNTFVAPILPEPIVRKSGRAGRACEQQPNGIEPSK